MEQFFKFIEQLSTFTKEEKEAISQVLIYKKLKQHTLFISEGKKCNYMAFILSGFMRTFYVDEDSREITSDFSLQNSFTSAWYGFYTRKASLESIEAITDCEVVLISYDALQKLYATSFGMNVMARRVLEYACIQRDLRVKKMISLDGFDRYQWFMKEFGDIYKVAQLQQIASFLGIKPETLSRIRRKIIS